MKNSPTRVISKIGFVTIGLLFWTGLIVFLSYVVLSLVRFP